ncbi:hypothetical protein HELRODRAFT_85907, partial [Helobdella robusta]|uniref:LRRCT domain-containing protein n=1 Tax=Helobdella robusta TaxID=6412 RepID=T1G641_HELRO
MNKISELCINNTNIPFIPNNCINKLKTLKKISLQFNQIEHIQKGLFDGMKSLEEIFLSNNKINSVDVDVFSNQTDLPSLHTHNLIDSIEDRFYLNNTAVLDLSHNGIRKLDSHIINSLKVLKELYLHSNLLTTLPNDFLIRTSGPHQLKVISLHNNSWDCSCENKWLKSWM